MVNLNFKKKMELEGGKDSHLEVSLNNIPFLVLTVGNMKKHFYPGKSSLVDFIGPLRYMMLLDLLSLACNFSMYLVHFFVHFTLAPGSCLT